jgi:hypothetical protein
MVKMIGCSMILAASALRIFNFRTREQEAISNLRDYVKLIDHVRLQIGYFSHPLGKILKTYGSPLGETIDEIQSVLQDNHLLHTEEIHALLEWASSIGNGYKNEQLNLCIYTKEKMERYLSVREKDYPAKAKTNSALTLLGGATLIVLFL